MKGLALTMGTATAVTRISERERGDFIERPSSQRERERADKM